MTGKDFSITNYINQIIEKFTGKSEKPQNGSQTPKNIPILPEQDPNDERIGTDNFERGEIVSEYGIYREPDPIPMPDPTQILKYAVPEYGIPIEPTGEPTIEPTKKGSEQWAAKIALDQKWDSLDNYDITYDNQGRVIEMKWVGYEKNGIKTANSDISINYADDGSFEVIKEGGLYLGKVGDTEVAKVETGYDAEGNEIYTQKYDANGNLLSTEKAPQKSDSDSGFWGTIQNIYKKTVNSFKNLFN